MLGADSLAFRVSVVFFDVWKECLIITYSATVRCDIGSLFYETHDCLLDLPVSMRKSLFFPPLLAVESRRLKPGLNFDLKAATSCQVCLNVGLICM